MLGPLDICELWFNGLFPPNTPLSQKRQVWFRVDRNTDFILRKRCMTYVALASEGGLQHWLSQAKGVLATTLLLDRIARASFRHTPLEFEYDNKARRFALDALEQSLDIGLRPLERLFVLLPLLASDRLAHQHKSAACLERLITQARFNQANEELALYEDMYQLSQRNILLLERFRRFPHRAERLGYGLTSDEKQFVRQYDWQPWL